MIEIFFFIFLLIIEFFTTFVTDTKIIVHYSNNMIKIISLIKCQ